MVVINDITAVIVDVTVPFESSPEALQAAKEEKIGSMPHWPLGWSSRRTYSPKFIRLSLEHLAPAIWTTRMHLRHYILVGSTLDFLKSCVSLMFWRALSRSGWQDPLGRAEVSFSISSRDLTLYSRQYLLPELFSFQVLHHPSISFICNIAVILLCLSSSYASHFTFPTFCQGHLQSSEN